MQLLFISCMWADLWKSSLFSHPFLTSPKLFWDVSRDNPGLHSSVPENVRSWLHNEHLPKIGHQRLLPPPNAASSGHRCALYYQNIKNIYTLLCRHRHKAQHKPFLLKKRKRGWYCRVGPYPHMGLFPAQLHQRRITPPHVPASQSSPGRDALMYITSCCLIFLFKRTLLMGNGETGRPAVNSSASPTEQLLWESRDWLMGCEFEIMVPWQKSTLAAMVWIQAALVSLVLSQLHDSPWSWSTARHVCPPWEKRHAVWSVPALWPVLKCILAPRLHWLFQACWWPPGFLEFQRSKGITCKITQFPDEKTPGLKLVLGTY